MKRVEPKVFLLAYTKLDDDQVQAWLDHIGGLKVLDHLEGDDGEKLVELSGRNCYKSFDIGLNPNIKKVRTDSELYHGNILKSKHGSVTEHATCTFAFEDISRVGTHELVRHRAGTAFCLAGDTKIYSEHMYGRSRNDAKKRTIKSLYERTLSSHGRSRLKLFKLRCLDEHKNEFITTGIKHVCSSGVKPCFKVVLEDGKSIVCSKQHRFLTLDGWKSLNDIVGGISLSKTALVANYKTTEHPIAVNGVKCYADKEWFVKHYLAMTNKEPGPVKTAPKARCKILPKFVKIKYIEYAGQIDTYDIETTGPHNFVANGIITHNSQVSLRYCRLEDLRFWIPDIIADHPEAMKVFEEVIEKCEWGQKELARIFDIENMESFHDKKQLTSAFRRVAPIGLATGINVSFNIRSLRWIIQMRTAASAEIEIRKIFCDVYNLIKDKYALLFQDFETHDTGDGLFEAQPANSKV